MSSSTRRSLGLAALAAALLSLGAAAPGAHATGGGPADPPEPPEPTADFTIKGSVSLVRCTTTAANIQVTAHGTTYPFLDKQVAAYASSGAIKYSATKLPRGTYRVTAAPLNGKCPYGSSTAAFASSGNVANVTKTASVTYSGPHGTKTISGATVGTTYTTNFKAMTLRVNNDGAYGIERPFSRYYLWGTWLGYGAGGGYPAGGAVARSFPDEVVGVWGNTILKDTLKEIDLDGASAAWSNGGIDLTLHFEADNEEIRNIQLQLPSNTVTDHAFDHDIVNITMTVRLLPAVDSQGRLTYSVVGTPKLHSTPEDQCVSLDPGSNPCSVVNAMHEQILHTLELTVGDLMSQTVSKQIATMRLAALVPVAQRGHLTKVVATSTGIVLVW